MSKITLSAKEWRTVARVLRSSTALFHHLLPHIADQCEVPKDEAAEACDELRDLAYLAGCAIDYVAEHAADQVLIEITE